MLQSPQTRLCASANDRRLVQAANTKLEIEYEYEEEAIVSLKRDQRT